MIHCTDVVATVPVECHTDYVGEWPEVHYCVLNVVYSLSLDHMINQPSPIDFLLYVENTGRLWHYATIPTPPPPPGLMKLPH